LVVGRQDPRPVFRALKLCFERGHIAPENAEIVFLASNPDSVKQAVNDVSDSLPVRVIPRLPHRAALALQGQASVLLLLAHAAERGIMTGKVFDYLVAGRPILAVPDDLHTTSVLLKTTGTGVALTDVESIARQLSEWYTRWRSDPGFNLQRDETEIGRYSRAVQAGELARILNELADNHFPNSR
jgi:hypothetical protein